MSDSSRPRNPSQAAPRTADEEWARIRADVLERIDIKSEAQALGVRFLNRSASGGGWLACYAATRTEKGEPGSAAVNVGTGPARGKYNDKGGVKLACSFFDLSIHMGKFKSYIDSLRHYAAVAGVTLPAASGYKGPRVVPAAVAAMPPAEKKKPARREDISRDLDTLHTHAVETGQLGRAASDLYVHRDALIALRVGYAPNKPTAYEYRLKVRREQDQYEAATIWPEYQVLDLPRPVRMSAVRRALGQSTRKECLYDRVRGVYIPDGWHAFAKEAGVVFVCEGGSDCAAIHSMGLGVLGIPQAGTHDAEIAELIRRCLRNGRLPARVRIVCMIDRDETGAGLNGMTGVSQRLANALRRPVEARYAPHIPRFATLGMEFGVKLPFMYQDGYESSPRWATLQKHKGVPKDSRMWLSWVANADSEPLEKRQERGAQFIETLEGGFEVQPQPIEVKEVASESTENPVVIGGSECRRQSLSSSAQEKTKADIGDPPITTDAGHPTFLVGPLLSVDWAVMEATADLIKTLPVFDECEHRSFVSAGDKHDVRRAGSLPVSCRTWRCVSCANRHRSHWAFSLYKSFNGRPLPSALWTGPETQLERITRKLQRAKANYVRISDGAGNMTVISTAWHRGATYVTPHDATKAMVTAIIGVVFKPPVGTKRFRPISASRAWKPPAHEKTGTHELLPTFAPGTIPLAHAILAGLGVKVVTNKTEQGPFAYRYQVPGHWSRDERRWAWGWAARGIKPDWLKPGDPPPDLDALYAALIALPVSPPPLPKPKKLTARERKAAERLAKFAATPGLFGVP